MIPHQLTLEHLREIAANLAARDREEILRMYPDLDAWVQSRMWLGGSAWALVDKGTVYAVGGVLTGSKNEGVLWLAGREGWGRRYIRHALRIFDAIKGFGGYRGLRCRCAADNKVARRFAEYLGFEETGLKDGLVHYGMAT